MSRRDGLPLRSLRAQIAVAAAALTGAVTLAFGLLLSGVGPAPDPHPSDRPVVRAFAAAAAAAAGACVLTLSLVGRSLRPLRTVSEGARRIGEGHLEHRVELPPGTELSMLADALNEMAANLRQAQSERVAQERMHQQLQIAHQIQASLLPGHPPALPGAKLAAVYRPAFEVGGDYYDFLALPSGQLAIVVADVSGKGVPASLVMACVRTFLRSIAPALVTPAEVLVRLNRFVCRDLREGLFITMVYALFDPQRRLLKLSSAGHDPALVVRAGGERSAHKPAGFPIGIDDGPLFAERLKEETLKLGAGDRVLLYTDGVIDTLNPAGEHFGRARLEELCVRQRAVGAESLVSMIVAALDGHAEGGDPVDDQTLVLLSLADGRDVRAGSFDA